MCQSHSLIVKSTVNKDPRAPQQRLTELTDLCGPPDAQTARWRSAAVNATLWSSALYTFLLRVDELRLNCDCELLWIKTIQQRRYTQTSYKWQAKAADVSSHSREHVVAWWNNWTSSGLRPQTMTTTFLKGQQHLVAEVQWEKKVWTLKSSVCDVCLLNVKCLCVCCCRLFFYMKYFTLSYLSDSLTCISIGPG